MTTKITIDPALVRTIYNLDKFPDAPKIQINNKWIGIEFHYLEKTPIRDVSDFARDYATWFDIDLPQIYIDIHRFKDMAIEWCAGKGYYIERTYNGFMGAKGMFDVGIALYQGNGCDEVRGFDYDPITTTISDAELAAISFVYKQIQKEKGDE